jgi:alpha-ketoglutarate-dependent 2,4-dichlorophenoxyacetate dioxygenase
MNLHHRAAAQNLRLRPLHPLFAAEVEAFDMAAPLTEALAAEIEAAMNRYAVLVFHDQSLSSEQQLAFTRWFGPLDLGRKKAVKTGSRLAQEEMVDLSNLDENGYVFDRNHRKILSNMGTRLWHTDSSYKRPAAKFSILSAHAVPPSGGETEYADMRAAYDALPDALRCECEGRFAEHWVHHSRSTLGFEPTAEEIKAAMPPVRWPLIRTHSGSGRKLIYIGAHARQVVGLSVPEGRILLRDLLEHATQRQFVYQHKWRVGDVVIWDNRAVLHRGCRYDLSFPRDIRRTTTEDLASLSEREA